MNQNVAVFSESWIAKKKIRDFEWVLKDTLCPSDTWSILYKVVRSFTLDHIVNLSASRSGYTWNFPTNILSAIFITSWPCLLGNHIIQRWAFWRSSSLTITGKSILGSDRVFHSPWTLQFYQEAPTIFRPLFQSFVPYLSVFFWELNRAAYLVIWAKSPLLIHHDPCRWCRNESNLHDYFQQATYLMCEAHLKFLKKKQYLLSLRLFR